ncbi:hypothetical protein R3P38DRAFT_2832118 [Favolaschia claudopus]|uniref:RING-type domain-containing protein n=1 Tax=Favolaschia claudopus TaxID=2862362 RepID=A0AAW0E958_9AGAR
MSSSGQPPQLHLSLPPNTTSFKRSFDEQFGYLESPPSTLLQTHEPIDGTSSTASSSSSSTRSPDANETRRKRARSSNTSNHPESRSSEPSSSSSSSSFDSESPSDSFSHSSSSQAPRRHLLLDLGLGRTLGSSVALGLGMAASELQLGGRATSEPPPRLPTPELLESDDVEMPDIDIGFLRDEEPEEEPTSSADHVRRSVDRFNAFERHISVLRSSSPPVIPHPTSLSAHPASHAPPIFAATSAHYCNANISASTPPRLDLNLPTTSLSPGPTSPFSANISTRHLMASHLSLPHTNLFFSQQRRRVRAAVWSAIRSASPHPTRPFSQSPILECPALSPISPGISNSASAAQPRPNHGSSSSWRRPSHADSTIAGLRSIVHRTRAATPPCVSFRAHRRLRRPSMLVGRRMWILTMQGGENGGDVSVKLRGSSSAREKRRRAAEREQENPWRLDSIWDINAGVESESSLIRMRRELEEDQLASAISRELRMTERYLMDQQREEEHASTSLAARYLDSAWSILERRHRPRAVIRGALQDAWTARPRVRRVGSSSRDGVTDWLGGIERSVRHSITADLYDHLLSDHPTPRSVTPAVGSSSRIGVYDDSDSSDFRRGMVIRIFISIYASGPPPAVGIRWPPRLTLSPQSAAQPARTATHARAQVHPQPVLGLAELCHGPALLVSIASAIPWSEDRFLASLDVDTLSDLESDYDFLEPPSPPAVVPVERNIMTDQMTMIAAPASSSNVPWRLRSQRQSEAKHEEAPTASSALYSRRPFFLPRRPIVRLRQPSIGSGDTVPSSSATSSVDRRHVSWEAPSTARGLSCVYHSPVSQGEPLPPHPLPSPLCRCGEKIARPLPDTPRTSSVPSLPPPDLGGEFERGEDMLRTASSFTTFNPSEMAWLRRAAGAARRLPEPPSIPPLGFSHTLEGSSTAGPSQDSSSGQTERSNPSPLIRHPRPLSYHSGSLLGAERRLFSYAGPGRSSQPQSPDEDPRRFFPSDLHPHPRPRIRLCMHDAQCDGHAQRVGSPGTTASDSNPADSGFEYAASRAQRLILQYHARAEADDAEPSSSSSSSPCKGLDDDVWGSRGFMSGMGEAEPPQLRHRALRGDFRGEPALNSMFTRLPSWSAWRLYDFDSSYETLLSLGGWIGDARPKATPDNVLSSLETATYKDWATTDSDQRCPICLDDYKPTDRVMKLGDCRHWLHKECLEQWLKGANTCPVCRNAVKGKSRQRPQRHHHPHPGAGPSRRRDDSDPDGGGGGPSTSGIGGSGGGSGGDIPHTNWLNFLRD